MMTTFEVGKPFLPALGLGEGARFDIGPGGAALVYAFDSPAPGEVGAMSSGQPFEIRFLTIDGIIWILSKCGGLEWTDAPYNPRLSSGMPVLETVAAGAGLGLTLVMLDSRDAVVKSARLIGLGTDFSRRLLLEAAAVRQTAMTMNEAAASIGRTMARYPTERLADMAHKWARYRL